MKRTTRIRTLLIASNLFALSSIIGYFLFIEKITDFEDVRVAFVSLSPLFFRSSRTQNFDSPIPKIIWQTYKTRETPLASWKCVNSWKRLNPDWEYRFMDDTEMEIFVKENFDDEIFKAWSGLPLGVMKADFWRYLIIYKYGGIYSDLDARCRDPIENWLPEGKEMVIGLENDAHFCQWAFAGVPGHPLLKSVIDLIVERFNEGLDTSYEHFVHHHTGPGVWTAGIKRFLGFEDKGLSAGEIRIKMSENSQQQVAILSEYALRGEKVQNEHASNQWLVYSSWVDEAKAETQKSRTGGDQH